MTNILTMAAVAWTMWYVIARELRPDGLLYGSLVARYATPQPGWRLFLNPQRSYGPPDAPITVVEIVDYACPHCSQVHRLLNDLTKQYGGKVRVDVRYFVLQPSVRAAAMAAECANRQGRFATYHDALLEHQDSVGVADWSWFARRAGVQDTGAFRQCWTARATASIISADSAWANRAGIRSLPTIFINGRRAFANSPSEIRTLLRLALHDAAAQRTP